MRTFITLPQKVSIFVKLHFLKKLLQEYSSLTMFCQFLFYSKVNQLCEYIYKSSFSQCLSLHRSLQSIEQFFVIYSRFLVVIYFTYSRLYMSIPISQFPLPHLPQVCFLHLYLYFCFKDKLIFTLFQIPHTSNIICYLAFSDLRYSV